MHFFIYLFYDYIVCCNINKKSNYKWETTILYHNINITVLFIVILRPILYLLKKVTGLIFSARYNASAVIAAEILLSVHVCDKLTFC